MLETSEYRPEWKNPGSNISLKQKFYSIWSLSDKKQKGVHSGRNERECPRTPGANSFYPLRQNNGSTLDPALKHSPLCIFIEAQPINKLMLAFRFQTALYTRWRCEFKIFLTHLLVPVNALAPHLFLWFQQVARLRTLWWARHPGQTNSFSEQLQNPLTASSCKLAVLQKYCFASRGKQGRERNVFFSF